MPVTIKDIAKIARVSHATVSRSLNDSPLVAEATKMKIKEIAQSVGFTFNASARSLSTNKSGTICVIYPENFGEYGVSFYYSSLLNQIRDSLEREGLDIIVSFPKNKVNGENNIKRLIISRKIDSLIIVHPNLRDVDEQIVHFMDSSRVPYIFLHHYPNFCDPGTIDTIYCDHFKGGFMAAEHLLKLGHRNIACISSFGASNEFKLRTEGYKAALSSYGIPYDDSLVFHGYRDIKSGYNVIKENIDKLVKNSVTGIFAQTDLMALGAVEALKELGYKVPQDFSIVGYDDIDFILDFKPLLTTIHQPREEIALLSCERLIELMGGKRKKKVVNIMLQPKLILRESTRQLK